MEDGEVLLKMVRDAIQGYLDTGCRPEPDLDALPGWLLEPGACFVTLTKAGELRGCIGSLEAYRPLAADVMAHAVDAAFRDPRFPPLEPREMKDLEIHVSVLEPPQAFPVADEADLLAQLIPGEDGLILAEGRRRATFLPSVWEQLADPADFVRHLKIKAGLPSDYWSEDLCFQRYRVREYA